MNITLRQNMTNKALSQYTNFFFDRGITEIGGKVLALNCNGLCQLGGDTDNETAISASIQSGALSFKRGVTKLRTLHVRGQFDTRATMVLKYAMDSVVAILVSERAITGTVGDSGGSLKFHGTRSNYGEYLCVNLSNASGEYFHINDIDAVIVNGSRK